jgi:hypothetical protein
MIGEINRKEFFDWYRRAVAGGVLAPVEVNNLTAILDRAETDERLNTRLLSSMIATARWETRRFERLREVGGDGYLMQYQGRGGNTSPGDYKRFRGGGWCHLTFRDGFRKATRKLQERGIEVDLEANPEEIVNNHDANYEVMVGGSLEGWFTKWRLGEFINDSRTDYRSARLVINPGELWIADGKTKANAARKAQCVEAVNTIVKWAKATEAALRLATVTPDTRQEARDSEAYEPRIAPEELEAIQPTSPGSDAATDNSTRVESVIEKEPIAPTSAPPPAQSAPEGVEPPVPANQGDFIQASIGGAKRLFAFKTAQGITGATLAASLGSLWLWAKSNPLLAIGLLVVMLAAVIGGVWIVREYIRTQKELDMLRMKSAMDKNFNTVR